MNTIRFFTFATLVSLASMVPLTALPLKDQIINEMTAVQAQPDNGIRQALYSKLDCLMATHERMPALYNMVSNLAAKLSISVPGILVYTGYNRDLTDGACALSLYHNFGTIFIGHQLIKKLSTAELEAILAHELSHIAYNHPLLSMPLYALGMVISMIPIVNKMHSKYEAVVNTLLRYHEVQADLRAVSIIDNRLMLCSGLDKIHGIEYEELRKACDEDPFLRFFLSHPSLEERKKYITAAAA